MTESTGRTGGRLQDRVAAVTGAAAGIGAAVARRLIEEGARVMLSDIQDDAGAALAAELGDRAAYQHCDVTSESQIESLLAATVERWGTVDIMHNNAGLVGAQGPVDEIDQHDWSFTIDVLLTSVFLGTKHAVPIMRAGGGGVIINTASVCGFTGGLGPHAYTAAKHAVIGFTRSTALELAADGIRVNAICPGYIVTDLTAGAFGRALDDDPSAEPHTIARRFFNKTQPIGRAGEAEDVAATVAWLASDDASWTTGTAQVIDGGLTAGVPFRQQFRSQTNG
ncbi:MAG: SDR family oxidoreductase [Acidimicrobiia bacterium]|nr:SDR family oxidoreductase [Acidimicrobiia bacterium]